MENRIPLGNSIDIELFDEYFLVKFKEIFHKYIEIS